MTTTTRTRTGMVLTKKQRIYVLWLVLVDLFYWLKTDPNQTEYTKTIDGLVRRSSMNGRKFDPSIRSDLDNETYMIGLAINNVMSVINMPGRRAS